MSRLEQEDEWRKTVPTRFRVRCALCPHELDTRLANGSICQWTAGWVLQRAGGGGHGVSLPERANRWAHRQCVEREGRGHTPQGALF